ncbi:related to Ras1 guanine nucleotide exchange factor [Ramularia collo-cygni]|uniref:Related to Ras1 guanine nucleotide exchange factor n=1 Tax=Ramularia collo-cygni TaxID=112498 RepID=A0A2D3VEU8_9PEZI|nr:related to Ras1 guanine nucleotide exchange factor [Ramularia collo-cygni]CZT20289.1 related to Ras1 guanine nucleotide exchange factor [Ramularia collo-cygni]
MDAHDDKTTAVTAGFVANITPPGTPLSQSTDADLPFTNQSLFHNYLRALHTFDPTSEALTGHDDEEVLSTVAIKPGNLILVHCIHANGWADGTVLNTGVRGWLPTNYCEAYDHAYLRNLLNAMTQFWDLIGAGEDANLSTFVRQDYIRGLIAGVRYLLEKADCLHRDSSTVKHHVGVRRMRKGLLADLSSLVQIAKRLQESISESFAAEVIPFLLDDLIAKAFKVVNRAVSFTDVWTQEISSARGDPRRASVARPLAIDTKVVTQEQRKVEEIDSAKHFPEPLQLNLHKQTNAGAEAEHFNGEAKAPRMSTVFTPPNGFAAHRVSLVSKESNRVASGPMASEQLAKVHDVCISHIGAFIGHHLQSRPCSELVAITERLVAACRNMLAIVDEVYAHDPQASLHVQQVKQDFETKVEQLAMSTKDVFRFSDSPDDEIVMLPDQTNHLINVGTSLIRNTGECVVKTRQLIEQIGDFELKSTVEYHPQTIAEIPQRIDSIPDRGSKSLAQKRASQRLSVKALPPPPPLPKDSPTLPAMDLAEMDHPLDELDSVPARPTSKQTMPPPPARMSSATRTSVVSSNHVEVARVSPSGSTESIPATRKYSVGQSISDSTDTHSSLRDSNATAVSQVSTRATTPDHTRERMTADTTMMSSFASLPSIRSFSTTEDSIMDAEAQFLKKTYANELTFNKEGQVTGGSLPALVEQLTAHDCAPDAQFVTAIFLTFRKFAEPREFAQALIARFDYIGDSRLIGTPARLRIYNVFKGWLETYWSTEADKDALGEIRFFALHKLKQTLPSAGERLIELTRRVTEMYHTGTAVGPLVSGVGKWSTSPTTDPEYNAPDPIVSSRQLNALRVATGGGAACSIVDLDSMEIARQITLMMMKVFCAIRPEEFLSMDWGRPNTKKAKNIRQMCLLNTDLSHLVSDSILGPDDPKKRAAVIKQWAKICMSLVELNNYDSIMAIMCTINSSVVQRLKRTWDVVNKKTRARLDELDKLVDMSKNYSALRKRLEAPTAPCLPFLGVYLTDLTFVIAGNPKRRELPGSTSETGEVVSVINFDMYMRISKIVSHLQGFQVPYKLKEVPEIQSWMEVHLRRLREGQEDMVSVFHQRSLSIEPRADDRKYSIHAGLERPATAASKHETAVMDRFDYFFKSGSFHMRTALQVPELTEQQKRASSH